MRRLDWLVAQQGAREHYAIAAELHRSRRLHTLLTDFWAYGRPSRSSDSIATVRALLQRSHPSIPDERVVSQNCRSIARRLGAAARRRKNPYDAYIDEGAAFARRAVSQLEWRPSSSDISALFAYCTGALELVQHFRARGAFCVVDQIDPSRVHDELVAREREKFPGWEPAAPAVPPAFYERIFEEWALADLVVVNSEWSRRALTSLGIAGDKLFVLPLAYRPPDEPPRRHVSSKLSVVWAGAVSLAKGFQYLVEAARLLRSAPIEFLVAGEVRVSARAVASLPSNVRLLGRVTREQMRNVYAQGDLYALPTISDGFAITQLEAMAHGLPVITTPRCGSVVEPGRNGLIVEAHSGAALAEAIEHLEKNRDLLQEMSQAALRRAREMYDVVFPQRLELLIARAEGRRETAGARRLC